MPSDYAGYYVDHTVSNTDTNIQDQGQNQNAREGSSRIYKVIFDNEGREIDLNKPYYCDENIDKNQDNIQNA